MTIYGYMENGQLQSVYLHEYTEKRQLDNGRVVDYIVTEEEQAAKLSDEWKPVDFINDDMVRSAKGNEVVVPIPYDAGDHIAYRYERRFDKQKIRGEIQTLKDSLAQSDYKVAKSYEAFLLGMEPPYDIQSLHQERQAQRDRINELEALL